MGDPIIEATQPKPVDPGDPPDGLQWAIVEVFGHRRLVGTIQEVEKFGAKMLRIDPINAYTGKPEATQFYGGASIFSMTLTTKEAVEKEVARHSRPALAYQGPTDDDDAEEGDF